MNMRQNEAQNMRAIATAWYVLQTKPNGHNTAVTHLARQGFRTLMPLQEVSRRTRFGLRSQKRPLFPGYVFFAAQSDQVNWTTVRNTRGISRIVSGTGGRPAQLPAQIATELLAATTDDGSLRAIAECDVGDSVSIIHGPLSGWLARVIDADHAERIRLLVDVMGRMTPLDVARKDIEKLRA